MMETLNDLLPNSKLGSGIFSHITNPVWSEEFDSAALDIYFAANYGSKFVSAYPKLFVNDATGRIDTQLTTFSNNIYMIYKKQWSHLYDDLMVSYDPISNTEVTETVTENRSVSGTDGNTRTLNTTNTTDMANTSTSSVISSGEGSNTLTGSDSANNNVYGFDSTSAVPDSNSAGTNSSNNTSTSEATTTTAGNSNEAGTVKDTGTITDAGTHGSTETLSRNYHKVGNIGVMTNVQLLRDDTDFWKWNFIKQVCEDICRLCALSVY